MVSDVLYRARENQYRNVVKSISILKETPQARIKQVAVEL